MTENAEVEELSEEEMLGEEDPATSKACLCKRCSLVRSKLKSSLKGTTSDQEVRDNKRVIVNSQAV
jgi:hypothetical protein